MARLAILKQFYASREWLRFRAAVIAERGLVCQHCGRVIAHIGEATVHHVTELTADNVNDPNVALNPDNVLVVHRKCHDEEIHKRFGHTGPKEVYIVYGMPLSGKATYVRQMQGRNDIVIEMDRLYEAITGLPRYDKPDSLLSTVRSVYNLLIDQVRTRYGKWQTAWIIGGFPEKYQREKLAEELGAELIYCECTREEALLRLTQDEGRRNMAAEYTRYIDEWLEKFSE